MAATIRYHLDEHVATAVALGLRLRSIDVSTTFEEGLIAAPDEDQLAFAAGQGAGDAVDVRNRRVMHPWRPAGAWVRISSMRLTVTIERDESGMIVAECPAIPGCVSQGQTEAEALTNIREAIVGCLEVRAEQGMPLTVRTVELDIAIG
jgi:predicted RNase H-like HicB family nuclease